MRFHYRDCYVDAAPAFSVGRFFAHVRISPSKELTDAGMAEKFESGDLGDFGSEADAVRHAQEWAVGWIDEQLAACRLD